MVVVGEALIDLVPAGPDGLFAAVPGGSPANVAVGLARLGVPTRMLARLAGDAFGRRLAAHLAGNGVDLSLAPAAAEPSSLAIVTVAPDGAAEYDFRVSGTADWQWTPAELAGALDAGALAVHAGSLAMTMPPGAAVLESFLAGARETAVVSYDPNCRPALMGDPAAVRPHIERLIGLADVVKASADDVAWLYPGSALAAVAGDWLSRGPTLVVITCGPEGALAVGAAAGRVDRPGRPVAVVDTVGAGDSFSAALLAGLYRRGLLGAAHRDALRRVPAAELAVLLDEAGTAAALTCTRAGADPPTAAELSRLVGLVTPIGDG